VIARWLAWPIVAYRVAISPLKPRCCRFEPTCSRYALDALRQRGAVTGLALALWRVLRCHPFATPGYDPVPPPPARSRTPTQGRAASARHVASRSELAHAQDAGAAERAPSQYGPVRVDRQPLPAQLQADERDDVVAARVSRHDPGDRVRRRRGAIDVDAGVAHWYASGAVPLATTENITPLPMQAVAPIGAVVTVGATSTDRLAALLVAIPQALLTTAS